MALIHWDGFDDRPILQIGERYSAVQQNVGGAGSGISSSGRTGKALIITTGILDQFDFYDYDFDNRNIVIVGCAFYPSLSTALMSVRNAGSPHIFAQLNDDYTISAWRYNGGASFTELARSSQAVVSNDWSYIELKVKVDPANGYYEIRINGTRWLYQSGINTSSDGTDYANRVRLIYNHTGIDAATRLVDDFYIADTDTEGGTALIADFAGPVHIFALFENANGNENDWESSSGGDNYTNVDETTGQNGSTDYNQADDVDAKDLYALQDLAITPEAIKAVGINQYYQHQFATPRAFKPVARVPGLGAFPDQDVDGDEQVVPFSATFARFQSRFERNPITLQPWTKEEINALQIGAKVTA